VRQRRVMAFYDALCRVLLVTNLAAEQPSKVTVELTTPQYVAPNGILLCLAGEPPTLLSSGELELVLLQEGGSQFELGGSSVVDATQDAFASARNWQLSRVEATTLRSVLSTDPFYAHSYHSRRYDDFVSAGEDAAPAGLVVDEQPDGVGNCALITGAWKAGTRYEAVLQMTNPESSSSRPMPDVWMAPLSYQRLDKHHVTFTVRGSKYGQTCARRSDAMGQPGREPQLFNACRAALRDGLVTKSDDQQNCVSALRVALVRDPSLATRFPYYLHPFGAPASLPTVPLESITCPGDAVPSRRNGGECVSCGAGAVSFDGTECVCPPYMAIRLVGLEACGSNISTAMAADTPSMLARGLCAKYTANLDDMYQGYLSDRLVNAVFVPAFLDEARMLLDEDVVFEANRTVLHQFPMNERRPDSPSRAAGLEPNCNLCDGDGNFEATSSWGQRTSMTAKPRPGFEHHIQDERYDAVNKFRLMGAALNLAGHPCLALFDPANPQKPMYGPYRERICAPDPDEL